MAQLYTNIVYRHLSDIRRIGSEAHQGFYGGIVMGWDGGRGLRDRSSQ